MRVRFLPHICALLCLFPWLRLQSESTRFSVRDDIEMVHFEDPPSFAPGAVQFSPGFKYFAVVTERGVLDANVVEATLWVFKTSDISNSRNANVEISRRVMSVTAKNAPVIRDLQWMDELHVAFLAQVGDQNFHLLKANAETGAVEPISDFGQDVGLFTALDVRNDNAVYTVLSPLIKHEAEKQDLPQSAKIITSRLESELGLPAQDGATSHEVDFDWRELWAVVHGKRFRVNTDQFQYPLHVSPKVLPARIALSPDGNFAVLPLPIGLVPERWGAYAINKGQPFLSQIGTGPQNLDIKDTSQLTYQFVMIDLRNGTAKALVDAPVGSSGGYSRPRPVAAWSSDGQQIALVNTYLPLKDNRSPRVPCVAVLTVATGKAVCLETLAADSKDGRGERFMSLRDLHFDPANSKRLIFSYVNTVESRTGTMTYEETEDGKWSRRDYSAADAPFNVIVQQSLNDPPRLVALDRKTGKSVVLLDPNAALRDKDLGDTSEYRWADGSGREWLGGLVKPPDYSAGRRYPLVIQTHGFNKEEFMASGEATTAFAARPLAAAGILVLQINDQLCGMHFLGSPEEAACAESGYESAIKKLVDDGIADPEKIGMIGFSQTGLYVMAMLTRSKVHLAAASVSDATVGGYLEFLLGVSDRGGNQTLRNLVGTIGTPPIGAGLKKWLTDSPIFNVEKISTPIRFEAVGPRALFFMWEPYGLLRYLDRPVEMIQIDLGTHPLSNPAERLVSQGGNVDWFRFWLRDEEDSDPAKAEQYARWRQMHGQQQHGVN